MRVRRLLLLAALVSATLPARETRPLPAAGDETTDNEMPATPGDAFALAQLIAFDEHVAAAAEIARRKLPAQPVADYAKMVFDEHGANRERSVEILRAIGIAGTEVPEFEAEARTRDRQRETLRGLEGMQFTRAFIDAMAQDHADAIALIDRRLLREAHNDDVTAHLRLSRGRYLAHLEAARALRDHPDRY
jgi:putative membrane protein